MELRRFLRLLRVHWRTLAASTGVALTLGFALAHAVTPIYVSSAQVFISSPSGAGFDQLNNQVEFAQSRIETYAELARSQGAAQLAVNKLGIDMSAADFAAHISASVVTDTLILTITAQAPTAGEAQAWAQATAEVLNGYFQSVESTGGVRSPVRAQVVTVAARPDRPISPNLPYNLAVALVLGPLWGLAIAIARDFRDQPIRSADSVGAAVGDDVPVLSVLHELTPGQARVAPSEDDEIRMLTLALEFSDVMTPGRHLYVVTSPSPLEGKSTVARRLAQSLAGAGKSTMLIDADLRRGSQAAALGLESQVGLSTVLRGAATLAEASQVVDPHLHVLAAGRFPPNPAELIDSERFDGVCAEAASAYEAVVVDTPPVLPVADTAVIATKASGVVLVVRHGASRSRDLASALERLGAGGARIAGVVIARAPRWQRDRKSVAPTLRAGASESDSSVV